MAYVKRLKRRRRRGHGVSRRRTGVGPAGKRGPSHSTRGTRDCRPWDCQIVEMWDQTIQAYVCHCMGHSNACPECECHDEGQVSCQSQNCCHELGPNLLCGASGQCDPFKGYWGSTKAIGPI